MVGGRYFNILKRRCSSNSSSRKRRCSSSSSSSSRGGRKILKTTGIDHLPDDILMEILIRIPAKDIVDSTKFVCRKWHEITGTHDFAYAHLHLSTPGLLVWKHNYLPRATFMSLAQGNHQVQMSDFIHTSLYNNFWTSCNGLILEPNINDRCELMITNPVTRHRFDLPPFITKNNNSYYRSAIAYVATRKEYKVVRTYYPDHSRVCCAILTVGVDNSWRLIDTQHLSLAASGALNWPCPLVTEGFVHWVKKIDSYSNYILSLNMETEVITHIPVPRSNGRNYYDYTYLSTAGSSLSLLIGVGHLKWEVWEMKPEMGEWTKLPDIDLKAHRALLNKSCSKLAADCVGSWRLSPSGWLKYREVIVFVACPTPLSCGSWFHVVYDVQTKDFSLYKAEHGPHPHVVHRNSLVRIC